MKLKKKAGLSPAGGVYAVEKPAPAMDLSVITYDAETACIKRPSGMGELAPREEDSKISWINVNGLRDTESIKRLGKLYNIHPLTIEDILNTDQQPKIEIFDSYQFFSVKTIQPGKEAEPKRKAPFSFFRKKERGQKLKVFLIDQVSIIIMRNVLITFQEIPGDPFDGIRKRILENSGKLRREGTEHLAYTIIDAVVDEYFLTINNLEDDIEGFEERAASTSDETFIENIQNTKKCLLQIKRAIAPLKENMANIIRHGIFFRNDDLKPFLQDLNEHLNNAIVSLDGHREWLTNIMEVNISVVSYQMNKVMKVLAVISTIFIPLTFIAGVYGMNFDFMPELHHRLGYPFVLGGMGIIAGIMIVLFKIRKWF